MVLHLKNKIVVVEEAKDMRKINTKVLIGSLIAVVIGVLIYFTYQYHIHAPLKGFRIHLNDDEVYAFLEKEDIERLLVEEKKLDITALSIKTVDLKQLEAMVMTNPWIEKADLYVDNGRYLNVDVRQRIPVARIFDRSGNSYYLDSTGNIMPIVVGYSYPALVFTDVPAEKNRDKNSDLQATIIRMAKYIGNDTFWSKQVVQVGMTDRGKFVMATLLGNQKVTIGDTSGLDIKFANLFAFYRQVSNTLGWDKYEELDLSFINQIVARPSLGWVAPRTTDTVVKVPEVLDEKELLQTLPANPMSTQ